VTHVENAVAEVASEKTCTTGYYDFHFCYPPKGTESRSRS
jgi:hypothetical protein